MEKTEFTGSKQPAKRFLFKRLNNWNQSKVEFNTFGVCSFVFNGQKLSSLNMIMWTNDEHAVDVPKRQGNDW